MSANYSESSEGEGEDEREELTLSKLANRSASRTLWRVGEEGAKGSAIRSLAGREEEDKSPRAWVWKWPLRWKASLDSVLESDDLLPEKTTEVGQFYAIERLESHMIHQQMHWNTNQEEEEAGESAYPF